LTESIVLFDFGTRQRTLPRIFLIQPKAEICYNTACLRLLLVGNNRSSNNNLMKKDRKFIDKNELVRNCLENKPGVNWL